MVSVCWWGRYNRPFLKNNSTKYVLFSVFANIRLVLFNRLNKTRDMCSILFLYIYNNRGSGLA